MTSVTFVTVGSVPKKLESNTFVNVGSGSICQNICRQGKG